MKTKFNHWFILLASLLMAGPALALPTNTVTTLEDGPPGSLRYYLPAGGTILFTNGLTGTMSLTNELDITNSVTIVGPGPGILTIIPGFLADCRIFNISAGTTNTISGLTIAHGNPSGPGGGILNAGVLTLMNCSISYNLTSISLGGGIYSSGPLTLLNCTIEDNTAQNGNAYGGGIYSSNTLTLVNCLVTGNYTYTAGPSGGGGIEAQGPLAMTNCTVSFNATEGGTVPNGGGIDIESDSSSLVNCTIASNSVTGGFGGGIGGGIDVGPFSSCMLISCTISGNSAGAGGYGGGIFVDPEAESAIFGNTIVSGNSVDPGGIQPDVFGYVQSLGYNLIGDVAGDTGWIAYGTATNADLTGSSSTGVIDPLLGPLRNNGGPTPTMAPALGSLVIDAGYSFGLTTDQRGSPRPFIYPASQRRLFFLGDGSDIGAVELPVAPTLTNTIKSVNGSTRMVISWAYDEPRMTNAPATNPPAFNLQSTAKLASGTWSVYQKNVVRIGGADHHFLTTDDMMSNGVPIMSEFFQLSSTGPKNPFIGPPITGSASNILTTTATLNGTDPPAGTNTVYWFVYGPDTNYGKRHARNPYSTSS